MDVPCLIVTSAPIRGLSFALKNSGHWTLGHDACAQLRVKDQSIAPLHARIACSEGEWLVSSLSKLTPFFVNDEPVHEAVLEHRDRLRIGGVEFVLLLH